MASRSKRKLINAQARLKNYMVMIHVNKVLQYYPLSTKNWKSKERSLIIELLAKDYKATEDEVVIAFAYYLAAVLRDRVSRSIRTQRIGNRPMSQVYEPLSPAYRRTKNPVNRNKFWINTGALLRSIQVWKYRKKVFLGIKAEKGQNIIFWNEQGTVKAPARPLFTPHVRMMSRHINDYFDRFTLLVRDGTIRIKPFRIRPSQISDDL